jgi:integrase
MRVSEMLGLKWDDINFDKLTIPIERTLSFTSIIHPDGT